MAFFFSRVVAMAVVKVLAVMQVLVLGSGISYFALLRHDTACLFRVYGLS